MSIIFDKHQFIKETVYKLEKILPVIKKPTNINDTEAMELLAQFSKIERESKHAELEGITHLARVAKEALIFDSFHQTVPSYSKAVLQTVIEEMMIILEYPNELKDRLASIEEDTVISLLKAFNEKTGTKKVLIIDNDLLFLNNAAKILSSAGFCVEKTSQAIDAIDKVNQSYLDCIIVNAEITDMDCLDFISKLHNMRNHTLTPIIVISNSRSLNHKLETTKLGADDFLTKPFTMDELLIRLHRLIERNERLLQQTQMDELTGLYTRKYFMAKLEYYFHNPKEERFDHSVIIFDLDYFKQVNDRFGHTMGDKVLITFANFISKHIRDTDVFARYGGEEFILLFPRTTSEQAFQRLDTLREQFSKQEIKVDNHLITQTFSGGIAAKNDVYVNQPAELLHFADIALYEAKTNGRNQLLIYRDFMKDKKRKMKILIVDDDAFMRNILGKELNEDGWQLLFASNGEEALESAKENSPQLILLDVWMPILSGYEVLEKLRNNIQFKQTAVIMLTGNNSEKDAAHALNMGADDYITKPFSIDELKARIKRLLRHQNYR